ncbi:hypothetical protein GPJ56_007539 [Histomonas meleagridis]|uniref:uncharacterized protein n=1 Tax=Histomonas meleagridis TaxID=135588 RepID=UPI003559DCC9|nr:hypothetical protein GPJ56_007539 [Histomonas meleagridis]KAH0806058.1 hypothetical protein GO595_001071 [Histomonas meleagridis]
MERKQPSPSDWFSNFVSIKNKSGRIIRKYISVVEQLYYEDVETILDAIVEDTTHYAEAREYLFDIATEKLLYPFADVEVIKFPNIFDLTPKIFSPKYFPEDVLNTPFNELNSKYWPFKEVSEGLFSLIVECDPFIIADKFWDMSLIFTEIGVKLAIDNGEKPEDVEMGFDTLFEYFLVAVFAFGVNEILETMKYSCSFAQFVKEYDTKKKFSMTHFEALVTFIGNIDENEYHFKFGGK